MNYLGAACPKEGIGGVRGWKERSSLIPQVALQLGGAVRVHQQPEPLLGGASAAAPTDPGSTSSVPQALKKQSLTLSTPLGLSFLVSFLSLAPCFLTVPH